MPTRKRRLDESVKPAWEPMTMTLVGRVAALIQAGTLGSKGDGGGMKKL